MSGTSITAKISMSLTDLINDVSLGNTNIDKICV